MQNETEYTGGSAVMLFNSYYHGTVIDQMRTAAHNYYFSDQFARSDHFQAPI